MEVEFLAIADEVKHTPPLDQLSEADLYELVSKMRISYAAKGEVILQPGQHNGDLFLIKTGAVNITNEEGEILHRIAEGDYFGFRSIARQGRVKYAVNALEDSLLYLIPGEVFLALFSRYPSVKNFFSQEKTTRLRNAMALMEGSTLESDTLKALIHRPPLMLEANTTAQEAAQRMNAQHHSAALIVEQQQLIGLVSDRDFRQKLVAQGKSLNIPLRDIMTSNPLVLQQDASWHKAQFLLMRHGINHLPVVDDQGQACGLITSQDLLQHRNHLAAFVLSEIEKAQNVSRLQELSSQLPKVMLNLYEHQTPAKDIGRYLSLIGESINIRLLHLVQQAIGPAPIAFLWVVAGSLAREEQLLHSDQDNALILDDSYVEEIHGEYFKNLAQQVCDGLNTCGYVYCPGNVMASNDQWRKSLSAWQEIFGKWIESPQPNALMHASIFFDMRGIYGDESLLMRLQESYLTKTPKQSIFLAHLAANAMQYRPPSGFFKHFVLDKLGLEEKNLNIKERGLTPIVDMARLYALASGAAPVNSRSRLQAAAKAKTLSQDGQQNLLDALNFINTIRIRHQAGALQQGQPVTNTMDIRHLNALEKRHLRDAFDLVSELQEATLAHFSGGHL